MSLQVWLPLNGDLHNQGLLEDLTINSTNVSFLDNGKIGKCFTGRTGYFNIPYFTGKKQLSVAYWVKVNIATSTDWLDVFRWYSTDGSTTSMSRNEFYTNCTKTGFWFVGSPNNISGKATTVGEWHHHAFIIDYSAGTAEFYINGISVGASTGVYTTHYLTGENFMIGENGLDLSINDLRIYDHCLSPKEVKELSKGLIAHYPLNDGIGGENLLLNASFSKDYTGWGKESSGWEIVEKDGFKCAHVSGALTTTYHCYQNILSKLDITDLSTTYTASGWIKCENIVRGTTNPMCEYYFGGWYDDNGTSRWLGATTVGGNYTSTYAFSEINNSGWVYRTWTIRFDHVPTAMAFNMYLRDVTGDLYFRDIKLEKGEIATPWIPNPNDALYSAMGLDNGICYDTSGYGHNGTITGTLTYNSDSPRYAVSSRFIGTKATGGTVHLTNKFTISTWLRWDDRNDWGRYFCLFGTTNDYMGLNDANADEKIGFHMSREVDGARKTLIDRYITGYTISTWYHIAIVLDGTTLTFYRNGTYQYSATLPNEFTDVDMEVRFNQYANTSIGKDHSLSDLRIYATALSAEDIKQLYEVSASIDNTGNVYGSEVVE